MKFKIQTKQAGIVIMAAVLCFFFAAETVSAQGRLVIKPVIRAGWQRDSNFHKAETDTRTVDTYSASAGFTLGYKTPKSNVGLNFSIGYKDYDEQDDVPAGQLPAEDFDYIPSKFRLNAQTQPTERILFGFDGLYDKTRDPASADASSNSVARNKYSMVKASPWLKYGFGDKFALGLKYTNFITDYSDDDTGEGEDTDENRGALTLYYNLHQRTSFNIDYQYWQRTYDKETSDYDSNQVMLNVEHKLNRITFGAGAGYHSRDFDKTVPSGDIESFVWKASVAGQMPKTTISLGLSGNFNDSGAGDSYYNSTRFDARIGYSLTEKLNLNLGGWIQNSDYETSTREDDKWQVAAGVDYLINDYFTVGLEGGTEERDSNETGKDYDNNFVKLGLTLNYDLGSSR